MFKSYFNERFDMNWKKFLLIGLAVSAFTVAAASRADAGISVGIGFGFPIVGGYYGYGHPGCYSYGYGGYPYGYGYGYSYYPSYGSRAVVYVAPRYYRHHHRR